MLRISAGAESGRLVLKLEGRLTDAWVREAETQWAAAKARSAGAVPMVDLRDVLSVDSAGRQLLSRMRHEGATFVVAGCAMRALVAELNGEAEPQGSRLVGRAADGVDWKGRVG
jgi:hypothetical protein